MNQNMGNADRIIRILAALIIGGLYLTDLISGTIAIILGLLSVVFLFTGSFGFCPLYKPFAFSTRKAETTA